MNCRNNQRLSKGSYIWRNKKTKKNMQKMVGWTKKEYLHIALNKIERRDGGVSKAAAQYPTGCTRGVKSRRVHLDPLIRRRYHNPTRSDPCITDQVRWWWWNGGWSRQHMMMIGIYRRRVETEESFGWGRRGIEKARKERLWVSISTNGF